MTSQAEKRDTTIGLVADVLRSGRSVRIRAHGASMMPTLWPGDILTIEPSCGQSALPQIGSIVLTRVPGGLRAHRVVAHNVVEGAAMIVTHGDALACRDPEVKASAVLGTVIARNDIPLDADQGRCRWLAVRMLSRSRRLQAVALKLKALHYRYDRVVARKQFA